VVAARVVSLGPQGPRALAELQPLAVLPELQEQTEPQACRARRPAVFRPKQKRKRKVQQEPRAFLPRVDEAAAFPQNRWS
jgi:hypothetical protein